MIDTWTWTPLVLTQPLRPWRPFGSKNDMLNIMGIEGEKPAPQCPPTPENRALIAGLIRGTMVGLLIPMKILMTKWDEWNLCSWE